MEKTQEHHSTDYPLLSRWGEVLAGWKIRGVSGTNENRLEIYATVDDVWFRAVVARDTPNVLVTFHRVYGKKVRLRLEREGFVEREEEG